MEFIKKNRKWITLGGLALALIACFMPFAKVSVFGYSQTVALIDTKSAGIIVMIASIVAGVLVFLKKEKFSVIASGIAAIVTIYNIIDVAKVTGGSSFGGVSISFDAILMLVGLIVAIVMPFIPQDK